MKKCSFLDKTGVLCNVICVGFSIYKKDTKVSNMFFYGDITNPLYGKAFFIFKVGRGLSCSY